MEEFHTQTPKATQSSVWEGQIDLTRKEYIAYYMQLSKLSGPLRLRNAQLIITLVFSVGLIALCAYEWVMFEAIDLFSVIVGGVLLLASLGIWWYVPRHVRRAAEKAYDETIAGGYTYYGTLRVLDDRIQKENAQGTNTVLIGPMTLFVETPEMMVFIPRNRRSIVIPARYLTAEAATCLRQLADKLPFRNRRFIGRLQPLGQTPVETPVPAQTILWHKTVRYEPDELASLMRANVTQNYMKQLPYLSVLSVLAGFALGWDGENILPCAGFFLLFFGIMTLLNLVTPRRRAAFAAQQADAAARTVEIKLTDRGVWLADPNSGFAAVPWSAVEHVVDRDTFVEIMRGRLSVRIPKRYIEDLSAFDTLICTYWNKTNSK